MASRLRDYSIMDNEANPFDIKNSPYPVDLGGNPSVLEEIALEYSPDGQTRPKSPSDQSGKEQSLDKPIKGYGSLIPGRYDDPRKMQALAGFIESIAKKMQAENNLELQIVPQGLRILIRDDEQRGHGRG